MVTGDPCHLHQRQWEDLLGRPIPMGLIPPRLMGQRLLTLVDGVTVLGEEEIVVGVLLLLDNEAAE